jgi:hypothetical protein
MAEKHPTTAEMRSAEVRGEKRTRIEARAERVHFDEKKGLIVVDLRGGAIVAIPVDSIRELKGAKSPALANIRAGFDGESITLDELDIDISVPGLLRDLIGITSAATLLGKKGGVVKSAAKAAAVRENGKLGGRPRKTPQPA